jgi:hypothetical protein
MSSMTLTAPGDLVTVRGVNGPVRLHRLAARAWAALVAAARTAGLPEPLLLPVSGYRSRAHQACLLRQAWRRSGSPGLARQQFDPPGASAHHSGRAIDCYLGGSNEGANADDLRQTPAYRWLAAHAESFGFHSQAARPWHWEYIPPGVPEQQSELNLDAIPDALRSVKGAAEAAAACAGGVRDASRLTDIVFQARHPERGGRAIARSDTPAAQEWIWIRSHLVYPLLLTTAAGPFLKGQHVPDDDRYRLLIPILDRYRVDIPLSFLLGWIARESSGFVDDLTPPPHCERGFFQISPDESANYHYDHDRLSTDYDYSVQTGIQLVHVYEGLTRTRYPWATPGTELYWRMVKLQHTIGGQGTLTLIAKVTKVQAAGTPITWAAIESYAAGHQPQTVHNLRLVDDVFTLGQRIAAANGR